MAVSLETLPVSRHLWAASSAEPVCFLSKTLLVLQVGRPIRGAGLRHCGQAATLIFQGSSTSWQIYNAIRTKNKTLGCGGRGRAVCSWCFNPLLSHDLVISEGRSPSDSPFSEVMLHQQRLSSKALLSAAAAAFQSFPAKTHIILYKNKQLCMHPSSKAASSVQPHSD